MRDQNEKLAEEKQGVSPQLITSDKLPIDNHKTKFRQWFEKNVSDQMTRERLLKKIDSAQGVYFYSKSMSRMLITALLFDDPELAGHLIMKMDPVDIMTGLHEFFSIKEIRFEERNIIWCCSGEDDEKTGLNKKLIQKKMMLAFADVSDGTTYPEGRQSIRTRKEWSWAFNAEIFRKVIRSLGKSVLTEFMCKKGGALFKLLLTLPEGEYLQNGFTEKQDYYSKIWFAWEDLKFLLEEGVDSVQIAKQAPNLLDLMLLVLLCAKPPRRLADSYQIHIGSPSKDAKEGELYIEQATEDSIKYTIYLANQKVITGVATLAQVKNSGRYLADPLSKMPDLTEKGITDSGFLRVIYEAVLVSIQLGEVLALFQRCGYRLRDTFLESLYVHATLLQMIVKEGDSILVKQALDLMETKKIRQEALCFLVKENRPYTIENPLLLIFKKHALLAYEALSYIDSEHLNQLLHNVDKLFEAAWVWLPENALASFLQKVSLPHLLMEFQRPATFELIDKNAKLQANEKENLKTFIGHYTDFFNSDFKRRDLSDWKNLLGFLTVVVDSRLANSRAIKAQKEIVEQSAEEESTCFGFRKKSVIGTSQDEQFLIERLTYYRNLFEKESRFLESIALYNALTMLLARVYEESVHFNDPKKAHELRRGIVSPQGLSSQEQIKVAESLLKDFSLSEGSFQHGLVGSLLGMATQRDEKLSQEAVKVVEPSTFRLKGKKHLTVEYPVKDTTYVYQKPDESIELKDDEKTVTSIPSSSDLPVHQRHPGRRNVGIMLAVGILCMGIGAALIWTGVGTPLGALAGYLGYSLVGQALVAGATLGVIAGATVAVPLYADYQKDKNRLSKIEAASAQTNDKEIEWPGTLPPAEEQRLLF